MNQTKRIFALFLALLLRLLGLRLSETGRQSEDTNQTKGKDLLFHDKLLVKS